MSFQEVAIDFNIFCWKMAYKTQAINNLFMSFVFSSLFSELPVMWPLWPNNVCYVQGLSSLIWEPERGFCCWSLSFVQWELNKVTREGQNREFLFFNTSNNWWKTLYHYISKKGNHSQWESVNALVPWCKYCLTKINITPGKSPQSNHLPKEKGTHPLHVPLSLICSVQSKHGKNKSLDITAWCHSSR